MPELRAMIEDRIYPAVPDGWVEKSLDALFDFSGGISVSRAELSTSGYPYLHYGDIHGSNRTFIDVCKDNSIPRLDISLGKVSNSALLKNGDVVFVDASEDDEGASRYIVIRNSTDKMFISGLHTIVAKQKTNELDDLFKEFCFLTEAIKLQFKFYAVGTKVTGVNKLTIKKISLRFPVSKSEQHAIAETLSDMDEYIASLEKLIAKKKAIKQGAMQELLTGKRRLPGFDGEWVEKKLGDIAEVCMCKRIMNAQTKIIGEIPFYKIGTFGNQADAYISRELYEEYQRDYSYPKKGDVLISAAGTIGRTVVFDGSPSYFQDSNIVWLVIDKNEITNKFLYHYYQIIKWASTEGSTISRLYNNIVRNTIILLPSLPEQTAIAAVLSDMEAEIEALSAKLNKAKAIKQGMMQELLTGRIRLVNLFGKESHNG
jgi:type I restriction enzyme S subunit